MACVSARGGRGVRVGRVNDVEQSFDLAEAAQRIGFSAAEVARLVELGALAPDAAGRLSELQLRRASMIRSLVQAGIPLEGLAAAIRDGAISFDFLQAPVFRRFSLASSATFADVAARTGVPVEQLLLVREASGSPAASPDDRMREAELAYADLMELAFRGGMSPAALQHMISSQGDGLRRVAETESAIWSEEVIEPAMRAGKRPDEVLGNEFGDQMGVILDRTVMAMYHLQQARAWTVDIIGGLENQLVAAGLHSRLEHPPAMCFLDISGYTRLTQERGDIAAADLAHQLGRIIQRTATDFGGRPVKWLGDGVMLHFPNPGRGVEAALAMVRVVAANSLPPAHVGLHAGPVIFQEGDYYGSTVNLASRIADRAGPGHVLVSQAVVDAASGANVTFTDAGAFELKGVAEPMPLLEASPRA
jgi:adenylate cyclase